MLSVGTSVSWGALMKKQTDENSENVARRRDDAVRRALNTPPNPHAEMKIGKDTKQKPNASTSKKPYPRTMKVETSLFSFEDSD